MGDIYQSNLCCKDQRYSEVEHLTELGSDKVVINYE